ncbi:MAG TPA: hypothetical protein VFV34_28895 [Blastocatellia bacterium]|nr:hypothetical protein [Blastocatellia bacterium]
MQVFVPFALLLSFFCPCGAIDQEKSDNAPARQPADLIGTWQGRFEGLPAVDLTIKIDANKLSGVAVLYTMVDVGSGPEVDDKEEQPIIEPRFDGKALTFKIKRKSEEQILELVMTLVGKDEAELQQRGGPDIDPTMIVKMTRKK